MIRINLLPTRQLYEEETGKKQLAVFAVLLLLVCVALYFPYMSQANVLKKAKSDNTNKKAEIERLKVQVKDVERLTKEKNQLEAQINVLEKLETGRSGPVRVLDDVQKVLSAPANPLQKLDFQRNGWADNWDPSQLWFNSFEESAGVFGLKGGARTSDDVAEFLQRLSSSKYFNSVRLITAEQSKIKKPDFEFVSFEITGKLTYSGKAPEPPPAPKGKKAPAKKPAPAPKKK